MHKFIGLTLAAGVSALAVGGVELQPAQAADMAVTQGQYQAPAPGYYGPPPVEEGYGYPPPAAYGYPPPVAYYAYAAPPVMVLPEVYYGRGPYWRGYGPRFARGYGRWDRGYRH
jgi:hypothetical protein